MTQFTINNDSILRLKSLSLISDRLEKTSDGILISFNDDTKMTVHVYGNLSILEYTLDIESFTKDSSIQGIPYIKVDLGKFEQALEKCNVLNAGASVLIDHVGNKINISSLSGNTKISISCYDNVDEQQAETIINDWTMRMQHDRFTNNTIDMTVSPEVIEFADTATRFMSITNNTNAIGVKRNHLYYLDRLCIIDKEISTQLIDSDETFYLHKFIYDFIKPIIKETKADVILTYSKDREFVKIENAQAGIRAVIVVPEVSFTYPTDEQYAVCVPEDSNKIEINLNKADLVNALQKFEGIFNPTEYRWKQVNVVTTKDDLDNNKINLAYNDFSAEVDTYVPLINVANNSAEQNFMYQIPTLILSGILDIMKEETLTIKYSCVAPGNPYGFGIQVITPSITAVCTKLTPD